jgi:hypothetical protein
VSSGFGSAPLTWGSFNVIPLSYLGDKGIYMCSPVTFKSPKVIISQDRLCVGSPGSFFFFFFVVLGFELRAYTLSCSTSPLFIYLCFEIGSCELFA